MPQLLRRLTLVGAAVAILAAIAWWMMHLTAVQDAVFRRVIERNLAATRNDLLGSDALRVVLCGTGNPLPDRNRADACTAIFAGGNFYLVDVGPGAWKNLALWHLPAARLAAVMLTTNELARIAFMRGVAEVRPRGVVIGYDGMLLTLPAGAKGIEIATVQ
jgi:ribonuclease Z